MNSKKSCLTKKRLSTVAKAVAPVVLTATPSMLFGQALTIVTFNNTTASGTHYTLTSGGNNSSGGILTSSELVDINHVAQFGTLSTDTHYSLAIGVSAGGTGTSMATTGALAFDVPVQSTATYVQFDAYESNTGIGTLVIAGGNTGATLASGATSASGDLITVTSNTAGTVDFGPTSGDGTLEVNLPAGGGNFDVAGNSTLAFGNYSALNGTGSININGTGTVSLSPANSAGFSGGFQLSNGVLSIGASPYALGASGAVTTMNGGTLLINGSDTLGASRPFNLIATTTGGIVIPTGDTSLLEGTISGAGAIIKYGGGTLALNSTTNILNYSPTYTGGVTINQGTVTFAVASDLGAAPETNTINGGVLLYNGTSSAPGITRTFVVNSDTSTIYVTSGTLTINGSVTGTGSLVKAGAGTLILLGTDTFAGAVNVSSGTLQFDGAQELGATPTTPTPNFILSGGNLELTANTTTLPFSVNRTVVLGNGVTGGVGTLGISGTHSAVFAGAFVDSGGAGTLAKIDTGTLILNSVSSTYTGGTTVYNGTLLANNTSGSATGSGSVNAGSAAAATTGTLGGSGFIAGDIVINNNGVLAPGVFGGSSTAAYTPGTLTGAGSLTLHGISSSTPGSAATATVIEKLASSTSYDNTTLTTAGSLTFDSGANTVKLELVSVSGFVPASTDQYNIITFPAGEVVTNFTATTPTQAGTFYIDPATLPSNYDVSNATIAEDGNDIFISGIQLTPEPTTLSIAAVAAGSLLLRRRRKRNCHREVVSFSS